MTDDFRSFVKSFRIQLRVIYALLMREIITRYGRHNIGFAWLFVEPMIFTLGIAGLWNYTKYAHGGTLPIIPFAVIGYSTILMWRNSANKVGSAVEANAGLLYHRNVKVIDVFLARIMLESLGATISFMTISLIFIAVGVMTWPANFLLMIYGWCLLAWFTVGLALIIGSVLQLSEILDRFWHPLTYLLFPISGTAFMVDWLPEPFRKIILYLPMVHATEMIRHGYYGDIVRTYEDPVYMMKCNLVILFIGLVLTRYVSRKIEATS